MQKILRAVYSNGPEDCLSNRPHAVLWIGGLLTVCVLSFMLLFLKFSTMALNLVASSASASTVHIAHWRTELKNVHDFDWFGRSKRKLGF